MNKKELHKFNNRFNSFALAFEQLKKAQHRNSIDKSITINEVHLIDLIGRNQPMNLVKLSELLEQYPNELYTLPKEEALNIILPTYNTDISGNEIPMKCQQYYRSKKDFVDKTGKKWDDRKYYYLLNPYADKRNDALIIHFPCYIQPKVNGVRAFIKLVNDKVKIFSKKGLEYNLPHISEWFNSRKDLFGDGDIIFDGELYIPGEHLQNISSAVRAMQLNTTLVKYYMFDIAIEDLSQKERFALLYSPIMKNTIQQDLNSPVVLVETRSVGEDKRVQELTDIFIKQGYEGSVCRSFDGLYQFGKRPQSIVKLKRTTSAEFPIIDVISQEVDQSLGLFVCSTLDGKEFRVTPKGNENYKKEVLLKASSFIGKQLTCVFYEYTEDGLPYHIIDNIVRDYE